MELGKTRVFRSQLDVDGRLSELGLDREHLLNVVRIAVSASSDATPYHAANAAGTFAYQHGTFALRHEFLRSGWEIDRTNSVEAIRNDKTNVKVVYSNVDLACDEAQGPKPRSPKGAGSERLCNGSLFGELPQYAPAPNSDEKLLTYFLMVDERGAAELTRPVIKGGSFSSYVERIYLSDGTDGFDADKLLATDGEIADGFDPQVSRK